MFACLTGGLPSCHGVGDAGDELASPFDGPAHRLPLLWEGIHWDRWRRWHHSGVMGFPLFELMLYGVLVTGGQVNTFLKYENRKYGSPLQCKITM